VRGSKSRSKSKSKDYSPLLPVPPLVLRRCTDPAVYIRANGEDSFNGLTDDAFLDIVKGKPTRVVTSNVSQLGSLQDIATAMFNSEAGDLNYDLCETFNLPEHANPFEAYVQEGIRTGATKLQLAWFWASVGNPDGGIYLPFADESKSPQVYRPYPVFGCAKVDKVVSLTKTEGKRLQAMYDKGEEYKAFDAVRALLFKKAGVGKWVEGDGGMPSRTKLLAKMEQWVKKHYVEIN